MAGTYVIDNVPDPVPVRGPCDAIENSGTFRFSFPSYTHTLSDGYPTVTDHPAKVDCTSCPAVSRATSTSGTAASRQPRAAS